MSSFSFFSGGVLQKAPDAETDMASVALAIQSDKWAKLTEDYRKIIDADEKVKFKKSLPLVTFSGTFSSRKADGLVAHSGYLCVDLDHVGTNGEIKVIQSLIREYYEPALMFISPGGDGLKVVFAIDIKEGSHLEYFTILRKFFKEIIKIPIDEACKDVSRACFLVHDPDVFYSNKPDILDLNFIVQGKEFIADDEKSQFYKLKDWTDKKESFIKGSRNKYITTLAGACHRFGMDEQTVLNNLMEFSSTDFTVQEIEAIVKSIYRNVHWHGIAKSIDELENQVDNPYMRVGTTFYKVIRKTDRFGIDRVELKPWTKDTILQDHKRKILRTIPKYDDFVMAPDNLNYKPIIGNCYNLYAPFNHTPAPGTWIWTERLLRHVFGEQYHLGIRYLQILYLHPDRSTIILVLVSKERGTGKTTFLNWIDMLFGANVALISSSDFLSGFNGHYATKNIICIEETLFEKKLTIEKLKSLATQKHIQINEKYVAQYKIPFFGKIIMTSNNEDKFATIDKEEIRFLVRKLGKPVFTNHAIEKDLLSEIPAFLDYLKSLPPVDWKVSRSAFTAEELYNKDLEAVILESKSGLYKDLEIEITELFNNNKLEFFYATPKDIKTKFYAYDHEISLNYIRRVLKDDFELQSEEPQRYNPFDDILIASRTGRPYRFDRSKFVTCYKLENDCNTL